MARCLLSYPLLFGIHVFKHARTEDTGENSFPLASTALFSSTMGLLPAIKGTFLLECVAVCGLCFLFLAHRRHYAAAGVIALAPALSLTIFWVMAGQPLEALPGFLINMKPIISGYSEAMALHGSTIQVVFYAITAAVLTRSALKNGKDRTDRLYIAAIYGVFLFICFKAAFVRHDIHALTGSSAVMLAALSLAFLHEKRTSAVLFILPLITWALIYVYFVSASLREPGLPGHLQSLEHQAAALVHRLSGSSHLDADFRESVAQIRERLDLPVLPGNSDIYFDDQADLIASGNRWAPRPVFQSYSAYTPDLAAGNVRHLQGSNAPDNLFVLLNRAVDDRLPSLADGPSWIPMLEEYHVAAANRKFVVLQHNIRQTPYTLKEIGNGEYSFYESIDLPDTEGPLWMEADIQKTLIGRMMSVIFKPAELTIKISLAYGPVFECRFVPSMARSKFLISPLVATTGDFAALATNDPRFMHDARIKSIEIFPSRGSTPSWGYRYSARFYSVSKQP